MGHDDVYVYIFAASTVSLSLPLFRIMSSYRLPSTIAASHKGQRQSDRFCFQAQRSEQCVSVTSTSEDRYMLRSNGSIMSPMHASVEEREPWTGDDERTEWATDHLIPLRPFQHLQASRRRRLTTRRRRLNYEQGAFTCTL